MLVRLSALLLTAGALLSGCAHPAERALHGRWLGYSVENFDLRKVAEATAWARGTSFEFSGSRLTVSVPAEEPRSGSYTFKAIEDRTVRLAILDGAGQESELELIVDDETSLRWVLGEGRAVVMKRK